MQHKLLQHLIMQVIYPQICNSSQTQVNPAVEYQPNTIVLVRFPTYKDCKIINICYTYCSILKVYYFTTGLAKFDLKVVADSSIAI